MEKKAFIIEELKKKNDYSFIPDEEFSMLTEAMITAEKDYMETCKPDENGDIEYDDDKAFDFIRKSISEPFTKYEMYLNAVTDDFLEASEAYLDSVGELEWI